MENRRQEELNRKRQKLAELRQQREIRRISILGQTNPQATGSTLPPTLSGGGSERGNVAAGESLANMKRPSIDKFIDDLIGPHSRHAASGSQSSIASDTGSEPGSARTPTTVTGSRPTSIGLSLSESHGGVRFIPEFSTLEEVIFDFPPKERVVYSKEAQTTGEFFDRPDPEALEQEVRSRLNAEREKERQAKLAAEEEERRRKQAEEAALIRDLSEEEKKSILTSDEFIDFVDYSTKVIERALNEKYDFMKDYTLLHDEDGDADTGNVVKLVCDFYDEKLCQNRAVTDVHWSPKHPELLVASYNNNPMAINEPDGLVMVWNVHLVERPEFTFHAQSDVLSARFSDFHTNLVIGGTYSGQILLWDTRAKALPVLRTPLSAIGHTHPVYSMSMVGTQNAHNLITASTDGLVCSWQLDMLAQPQETLDIMYPAHPRTDEVAITCIGFPDNETTTFWTGTEEGNIYQANRYDRAASKAGVNPNDVYRAHHGAITGLHFHPLFGPVDFSDLFLTSSVDWTVKLWRAKSVSKPSATPQTITPIYSFEDSADYVYDVAWSPSHPAVFGSVDGTGHFNVWNLNVDTDVPIVSTATGTGRALNKIDWEKDGRKAAVSSLDGHVYVYDIGELSNPRMEEWTQFQKTVNEMGNANKENGGTPALTTSETARSTFLSR
ncbi:WD40-repeat-containing domain protein [Syncephalis fuscata]|nr:WD40-repeat-containing domain protein [Syncephalis fuscata]